MREITYINLQELLNTYPNNISNIKSSYLELLSQLTTVEQIENLLFLENINKISKIGSIMVGYVGNPEHKNFQIIASGTIIIEPKIIWGGRNVGHIEDIVVTQSQRGKGFSQTILNELKNIAITNNCYKVILNCTEQVKKVYDKNSFEVKGLQMAQYFT